MMVLVCYDVETAEEGQRRLNRIAKACKNYGQRVQNSVFECKVAPDQWAKLKDQLLRLYKPEVDSLRFYYLGSNWQHRVEHFGAKKTYDPEGPLVI
ncbi:MAG: CRISPR-associated endonuclease Cas2 [candidate division KSB1 bacterium]|nr:CRISPR-associated endonuclease Cas2 [candidate division KSB1 bacterium]MDZ7346868.1 CRISPR-associated endonuclease Cas2 [candidate division KSB1 bacterium]